MLNSASEIANSHLPAVEAQTLILSSGKDQLLPSLEEGERLSRALRKCDLRNFNDNGHFLFLEDGVDLVTILKGTCFYRHAKHLDYVLDYMPPTSSEIKQICESYRVLACVIGVGSKSSATRRIFLGGRIKTANIYKFLGTFTSKFTFHLQG